MLVLYQLNLGWREICIKYKVITTNQALVSCSYLSLYQCHNITHPAAGATALDRPLFGARTSLHKSQRDRRNPLYL